MDINKPENNIYYIIEVSISGEKLYMYSKRVGLHFPDIAKKFMHKRSAQRYYKDSYFDTVHCPVRYLEYDKENDKIL